MKRITVGTETTLVVYEDGSGRALQDSGHVSFYSRAQGIELANAILAALGEPVEAKPDRSELDKLMQFRWRTVDGAGSVTGSYLTGRSLDYVIDDARDLDGASAIYELVAYVGSKPEPAERKVVRLD